MRTLCCIAIFALAPVGPAGAQNSLRQFAGRWDLTVTSGESVFPSWLEVAENDGRPQVRAQEREGAVHPVPAEFVAPGRLIVTVAAAAQAKSASAGKAASPARPARFWEFTLHGDRLEGVIKSGGRVQAQIRGLKAPALKHAAPFAWSEPESLFNRKDLTGWTTMNNTEGPRSAVNHWVVRDGELVNEAKGHNIRTTRTFGDFKLHVEFNLEAGSNSGVYLRGRYECQMPPPPVRTEGHDGYAIYGMVSVLVGAPTVPGKWHAYDITLVGRYVTLVVDGVTIVDNQEIAGVTGGALDSNEGEPGPIYFQGDHTGGIRYRNITISVPKT